MKHIGFGVFFWLLSSTVLMADYLNYLNPSDLKPYRFSLETKSIQKLTSSSKWIFFRSVEYDSLPFAETPINHLFYQIPSKDKNIIYFHLNCTNQIFSLSLIDYHISRLDQTFYRGNNCLAYRFFRKGEFFSLGGYGLWRTGNHLIRFSKEYRLFDGVNSFGDPPTAIYKGLTQYLIDTDEIITFSNTNLDINVDYGKVTLDHGIYKFSFKTKTWNKLGEVTLDPIREILTSLPREALDQFVFTGKYFVLPYYFNKGAKSFYFIEPKSLKVYKYEDKDLLMSQFRLANGSVNEDRHVFNLDSILINYVFNVGNKSGMFVQIDLHEIFKKAVFIGYLNEKPWYLTWWFFVLSACSLICVLFFLVRKKFKNRSNFKRKTIHEKSISLDFLDLKTKEFLIELYQSNQDGGLDMDVANHLLGLDSLGHDAQRYKRSAILKEMNGKLAMVTNRIECIIRVDSVLDKRQKKYQINPDAIHKIGKLIK